MKRLALVLSGLCLLGSIALADEVGYVEDFALAKDRTAALRQLIPGTEDYYYYHCLHYLNTEQYAKAVELTRPWHERFGQTARLTEIQTRHALLTYERNPQQSLDYLKNRLGLHFDHQKAVTTTPNLPTALDSGVLAWNALRDRALAGVNNLDRFEDSALERLATENLDPDRRRSLLQRLTRPDVPNLPRLVADELQSQNAADFGAYPIHRQLTLAQLEELVTLRPALLNHTAWVQAVIARLHPGADEDWRHDPSLLQAYLDRLLTFVRRLSPAHNALKAHVLNQRLTFDRTRGVYDKALFLEYLKLPRQQPYMAKRLLESTESQRFPANLGADFTGVTLLPPIHTDEPLVRSYLRHLLIGADSPREFEPYVNDEYLRHLFAQTKIEEGLGEPERWASELPPEEFRQLRERIDIDFAFTNKANFAADEPVRLDVHVKNVPSLIVKVFEINTVNFYREHQREVDTDINLDGLVASSEQTYPYADSPFRRVVRRFDFPQLQKPGVYVVDFIGAGKSSRALVRKGRLRPLVATSTAGELVTVVDEADRVVKDATLWLGGQEYHAGDDGRILIPFSTNPGRRPVVLGRGDFAALDGLPHQPENYGLTAGIYVDREALLSQRVAPVLVRPGLYLNGNPVSIKLLEDVKLRLTTTDQDGIATSIEVPNFKLFEDRESVYQFRVPPRLSQLNVALTARVKSLITDKHVDLAAADSFVLNQIEKTDKIEDLHLARVGPEGDYVLELLGRTGEVKADRPVHIALKHRDFREPVPAVLKSDAQGRIYLGRLADIVSVSATGPEGTAHTWPLTTHGFTYDLLLQAKAGEVVTVPYFKRTATRDEVALFEVQGDVIRADRFSNLHARDGLLEMEGLPPGDYDLWLKREGQRIHIRVAAGPVVAGHVLSRLRHLELPALKPVQIADVTAQEGTLTVHLKDASPVARVHVFATRYQPAFSVLEKLGKVRPGALSGVYPAHAESTYLTGRNIGDEYRYVLDRRYHKKYPGNMLERPALLLNPWAVRSTETGEQQAAGGDVFAPAGEPPASAPAPAAPGAGSGRGAGTGPVGDFASLDFLAEPAKVILNLVPDEHGVVKLSRKELGAHALLHVVAVDPLHLTYRAVTLPEPAAKFLDLRLAHGFDSKGHFTQQQQVDILTPGKPFVLNDVTASRFEAYDSLAKVYALYATLSREPKLAEFSFILNWPKLKPEEKRTQYSKYASHELNFFLYKKDPEFFRTVVKPYLANKKDRTFLDRWLLEEDLGEFLKPWQFERLNVAERVLLAQRIQGEPARTSRYLQDLVRLLPPNRDREQMLFETAVKAGDMDVDGRLGATKLQADRVLREALNDAAAAPAGAGGRRGGMGGGQGTGAGGGMAGKPAFGAFSAEGKPSASLADAEKALGLKKDGASYRDKAEMGRALDETKQLMERAKRSAMPQQDFFANTRARQQARQLYRQVEPTQEWAENNYYHLPIQQQLAGLVPVSPFWLDYARHEGAVPVLSPHLAEAGRSFPEMLFALALLDLPFESPKHNVVFDGGKMTLTPAGPVIAFHEEARPAAPVAGKPLVLLSQNFYRSGDRFRDENGEKVDKFVTDEFVIQTVYGCQVVVTNPTSARQKLSLLLQVPVGAIPVGNAPATRTVLLDLEPYRTQTVDYLFYFPRPGRFAHFPAHVARNERLVAAAEPFTFDVVAAPTRVDTGSWDYISQNGTLDQVLALLERENVHALDLDKVAFRMRDRVAFESVLRLLRARHVYQPTLWSYGLYHNATEPAREFLTHADQLVAEAAGPLQSPLLTIDPVARYTYEHLEYKPLVNARAHALGHRRQIVNHRLAEQYHRFLKLLTYRQTLSDDDRLALVYYLLLQDRVEEALAAFGAVDPAKVHEKLQYDYCAAYLDFYGDEPAKAREIAARHAQHPVDRWRNAFVAVLHQLDEAEGKGPKLADVEDRNQKQGQLAAGEPGFEATLVGRQVQLTWQNLESASVRYYLMDVELLFSRNPFAQQQGSQFAQVRPNRVQEVKLPAGQSKLSLPLPEDLARRNLLVEVAAAGKTRALPFYAGSMDVRLMENYGQLRTTSADGKPLAKVYVKVYARLADGQVKFHKDGYTDLRGRFDYASVSTPEPQPATRFALLVLSDEHGAAIREAAPPQR